MTPPPATPEQWLRAFEAAVRARDFAGGRTLFAGDAVAFGTWARAVAGLDNIVREQWQNVWPRIRDFHFEPGVHIGTAGDTAWIAGGWLTEVTGPDGRPFTRPGRGTFVLERRDGTWGAVHSHFSLLPSQSESAHGRLPTDATAAGTLEPAGAGASDLETLRELNRHYIRSVRTSDVRWFDEHLAENFLNTNPDGSLVDRAGFLGQIARRAPVANLEAEDVNIRVLDATAIIHARTTYKKPDGQPGAGRYTDIWARRGGRWLCVAAHVTRG